MSGVRHSREQWVGLIFEQAGSGQTISAFCDSIGVAESSFYRWRARLAAENSFSKVEPAEQQPRSNEPPLDFHGEAAGGINHSPFVPLTLVDSEQIEIDLPCGAIVRVAAGGVGVDRVLRLLLTAGESAEGGAAC